MCIKKIKFVFLFLMLSGIAHGQFLNSIWCFGDSAGVDFSVPQTPTLFKGATTGRGSCASLSDSTGLLFYCSSGNAQLWNGSWRSAQIFNKLHQVMDNGDTLVGETWYQEMIIVPDPIGNNKFYVFQVGSSLVAGLFYSVVDMNQNGGLGKITQKNIPLVNTEMTDCVSAVKHGNGRDWWIITRRSDISTTGVLNDEYIEFLVTPSGIMQYPVQHVGGLNGSDLCGMTFNSSGNKFVYRGVVGLLQLFDFNRCTGIISLSKTIRQDATGAPYPFFFGESFSANDNILYISSGYPSGRILQLDLTQTNPWQTRDTIASLPFPPTSAGTLRLAPDGNIYWACAYYDGVNFNFPYSDTTYNTYNTYLSVINSPDSLGAACDFQPYSFYLGGARTYYGLPNNPNYEMGRLIGSPCDTLTSIGIEQLAVGRGVLKVFYHTGWQKAFINANELKGKKYLLQVFDEMGKIIFNESGKLDGEYFTKDLNCAAFANGMYVVSLQTEKEKLDVKFVKQ